MKYIEPAPTPIQQPPPARLLEPRIAAVDRLFDLGEGSIGPPSLHIFSFQLWQSRSSASLISLAGAAFVGGAFCEDLRHGARLSQLFRERFANIA